MKTIKEIVSDYLEANNFDGLFHDGDCSCLKDDLFICGEICDDCTPGKLINCEACSLYSFDHERCVDGNDYCIGSVVEIEENPNRLADWELLMSTDISELIDGNVD